jgi:hypothetical protein
MAKPRSGKPGGALSACPDCGDRFDPRPSGRGIPRRRCRPCQSAFARENQKNLAMRLRAIKAGAARVELVIRMDVFLRDDWICHLCGDTVPEKSRGYHGTYRGGRSDRQAPVVDHVIPLSMGGDHTFENCKTAHRGCNSRKWKNNGLPKAESAVVAVPVDAADKCSLTGCPRPNGPYCKGMCRAHHTRVGKTGDPLKVFCQCGCKQLVSVGPDQFGQVMVDGHGGGGQVAQSFEDQLRTRVHYQPVSDHGRRVGLTDDCHIWTGPKGSDGYGTVSIRTSKGKRHAQQVHRAAYESAHGADALTHKVVDHVCRERLCFNVNHLEAVTHAENLRRGADVILTCPKGHVYDEANLRGGQRGRACKQCQRNNYHRSVLGHDFVVDPTNLSVKRARCLVCREAKAKRK